MMNRNRLLMVGNTTGTRSKIFNEIVFKDSHLFTLHEKCIYITIERDMVMQLNFTHLPKFVWHSKYMVAL